MAFTPCGKGVSVLWLTSITPATVAEAQAISITLNGAGFTPTTTVIASDPGIAVSAVAFVSSTQMTCTLTVAITIPVGSYSIKVQDGLVMSSSVPITVTLAIPPVAGFGLWLDALQLNLADNTSVPVWSDLSGNGRDFVTRLAGPPWTAPKFRTGIMNTRPGVRFNGTTDQLESLIAPFQVFPQTLIIVLKWLTSVPPNIENGAIAFQALGAGYGYGVRGEGFNTEALELSSSKFTLVGGQSPSLVPQCDEMVVRSAIVGGIGAFLFRNGVNVTGIANTVPSLTATHAALGVLASDQTTAGAAKMGAPDIAEVVWWPFELTGAQLLSVYTSYFKPKWGLP